MIETVTNFGNQLTQGIQPGFWDITTAVDNTKNRIKITLYPNPATDYVNLEMPFQENLFYTYLLYDLYGKSLQNSKITSSITRIDLNTYPVTVYILNVLSPDKKLMKSFKLLKRINPKKSIEYEKVISPYLLFDPVLEHKYSPNTFCF